MRGTKFNSRPTWKVIAQIAKAFGNDFNYENTSDVFDDIAAKIPEFNGMSYESIGTLGELVKTEEPVQK
jgi:predicted molibdopterin-dependent oxidoreductase YjgC